jgi:hypothetical protein
MTQTNECVSSLAATVSDYRKKLASFEPLSDASKEPESDKTISLRTSIDQLSQLITQRTYFSPSFSSFMPAGTSESESSEKWSRAMEDLKNEIRSIKGLLLSKKNFPGAAPAAN